MYGTPTVMSPGMHSPCRTRRASSSSKLGASATRTVGGTIAALASTSDARRPIRSDSGPQNQAPTASAPITTEMLSPARDGETSNVRPSSGRIAWVEYMTANIAAAATRNGAMPAAPRCDWSAMAAAS